MAGPALPARVPGGRGLFRSSELAGCGGASRSGLKTAFDRAIVGSPACAQSAESMPTSASCRASS